MREFTEQELVRREKVDKIREFCNPYPERYEVTHSLKEASQLEDGVQDVSIAGRIVFVRPGRGRRAGPHSSAGRWQGHTPAS